MTQMHLNECNVVEENELLHLGTSVGNMMTCSTSPGYFIIKGFSQ